MTRYACQTGLIVVSKHLADSVPLRLETRVILLLAAALFAGCGKEEITVYRVPKENPSAPAPVASRAEAGHEESGSNLPRLRWKLPAGWEEQGSGGMSVVSFL